MYTVEKAISPHELVGTREEFTKSPFSKQYKYTNRKPTENTHLQRVLFLDRTGFLDLHDFRFGVIKVSRNFRP